MRHGATSQDKHRGALKLARSSSGGNGVREIRREEADLTLADVGGGVAAGGTGALLEVEATAVAANAERVCLVPAHAEAARTLPLQATTTAR